jgi:hypothetical protein
VQPGSSIAISITELPREYLATPQEDTVNYPNTQLKPTNTFSRKLKTSNHEARQVRESGNMDRTAANGFAQIPYEVPERDGHGRTQEWYV